MKATKITNADITPLRVSSLPSRPTAPKAYGGLGYTAAQMKSAFDAFPMFLANKFNALMTDITATGENSMAAAMKTGISSGHTLYDMFLDIKSGDFASYLDTGGRSLMAALAELEERLAALEAGLAVREGEV